MNRRLYLVGLATLCLVGSFAASASAEVKQWGSYLGATAFEQPTPNVISGLQEVSMIDAGNASSYALGSNGTEWAFGNGEVGELGNDAKLSSPENPVQVTFPAGTSIVSIGEAKNEGMAIDSTGHGWAWGENGSSSLCLPGKKSDMPAIVPGIEHAVAVQGGQEHTLWLLEDGKVLACGTNAQGQLGLGEAVASVKTPTEVPGLTGIVEISAGNRFSAARDNQGRVFMWGDNERGQVGVGTRENVFTATRVKLPGPATQVSAGGDLATNGHTLALVGGVLYGWGDDKDGQVGDGSKTTKLSPVDTGMHYVRVAAGGAFSLGLDSAGAVWAWGSNSGGSLGTGSGSSKATLTPAKVDSGAGMISATAKNALDSSG